MGVCHLIKQYQPIFMTSGAQKEVDFDASKIYVFCGKTSPCLSLWSSVQMISFFVVVLFFDQNGGVLFLFCTNEEESLHFKEQRNESFIHLRLGSILNMK